MVGFFQSSTTTGLTEDEARRRLAQYGRNVLPLAKGPGTWWRLLRQFHNVLIYVLLVAATITAGLGHWVDRASSSAWSSSTHW